MNSVHRFLNEEIGATSVEYAVMLMLIAGACISVIQLVGGGAGGFWSGADESLGDVLETTR